MSEEKEIVWKSIEISDEEIARILNERPGGRKAGRGDSPYTQEFYEETYGFKKEEIEDAMKEYGPTKAGEGDSPYTQEFFDSCNGKGKRKKVKKRCA